MAKARIELVGASTFSGRGRTFEKNVPVIINDDTGAEIAYFKSNPEFSVSILEEAAPMKAKKKRPSSEKTLKADKEQSDEPKNEEPQEEVKLYTREDLSGLAKSSLVKIGIKDYGISLEDMKKPEMIDALLEAQEIKNK